MGKTKPDFDYRPAYLRVLSHAHPVHPTFYRHHPHKKRSYEEGLTVESATPKRWKELGK
jgi:hypothetical protein